MFHTKCVVFGSPFSLFSCNLSKFQLSLVLPGRSFSSSNSEDSSHDSAFAHKTTESRKVEEDNLTFDFSHFNTIIPPLPPKQSEAPQESSWDSISEEEEDDPEEYQSMDEEFYLRFYNIHPGISKAESDYNGRLKTRRSFSERELNGVEDAYLNSILRDTLMDLKEYKKWWFIQNSVYFLTYYNSPNIPYNLLSQEAASEIWDLNIDSDPDVDANISSAVTNKDPTLTKLHYAVQLDEVIDWELDSEETDVWDPALEIEIIPWDAPKRPKKEPLVLTNFDTITFGGFYPLDSSHWTTSRQATGSLREDWYPPDMDKYTPEMQEAMARRLHPLEYDELKLWDEINADWEEEIYPFDIDFEYHVEYVMEELLFYFKVIFGNTHLWPEMFISIILDVIRY